MSRRERMRRGKREGRTCGGRYGETTEFGMFTRKDTTRQRPSRSKIDDSNVDYPRVL